VTIWRNQEEQTLEIATTALPGSDVDRLVQWAGATLQAPHRAMSAQRGIEPTGVYVAHFNYGSPATRYGLYRAAHRRGRRRADAGSGRLSFLRWCSAPRPLLGAPEDPRLEQRTGSDHAEARQALLAGE
jgi:hypothetical protein